MKKLNATLNSVMGISCGWFLGKGIYAVWDFKTHPEVYAMQSAPCYTDIMVYGVIALVVLLVCLVIKAICKYHNKKAENDVTE